MSLLQRLRMAYQPQLPRVLGEVASCALLKGKIPKVESEVAKRFPHLAKQPIVQLTLNTPLEHQPLQVGILFSGGQAPGGHNVIAGLFDALKELNAESRLIGFLNGPQGLVDNQWMELTDQIIAPYRNQGGFDLIGSGRAKLETPEQFQAIVKVVKELGLQALVIVGGDDSNTNAAFLAEHFLSQDIKTQVIGIPKTIDGDLKNENIEISFGFDTACKTYSEIIGNLLTDAISAKKYYYFVKLMGRSASHIALECALQTHPNMTLIGEEVAKFGKSLKDLVHEMADLVCERALIWKDYGVILIPEGVIEFIPEFKRLIRDLNQLLLEGQDQSNLVGASKECFESLPETIQKQLLLDRDSHGNVQVSKIETERLFLAMVEKELEQRKKTGRYKRQFNAQPFFCGYEGRSALPSNFDCQYCYALGFAAAILIDAGLTGYMVCINNLSLQVEAWEVEGVPLLSLMVLEERNGQSKPVIKKSLVNLEGKAFNLFKQNREKWRLEDDYSNPGPIQFFGPQELTDNVTYTLDYE
jgi:diphosphate-dependent phosphofructokinase